MMLEKSKKSLKKAKFTFGTHTKVAEFYPDQTSRTLMQNKS